MGHRLLCDADDVCYGRVSVSKSVRRRYRGSNRERQVSCECVVRSVSQKYKKRNEKMCEKLCHVLFHVLCCIPSPVLTLTD